MIFTVLFALLFGAAAVTFIVIASVKFFEISDLGYSSSSWGQSQESANKKKEQKIKLKKKANLYLTIGIISIFAFIMVPWNFHQVDSGEVAVIKRMGQVSHVREAGTHFDFWLTNSRTRYDTKIRSLQIETQAYSQDAQTMTIQMSVHYQILADKATDITIKYGSLDVLESRITGKAIQETKDVLTKRGAEKIIEERNLISQEVAEAVEAAIGADYFVDIQTVALTNIDFSDAFEKAVEEKMVAAQKKLQAEIENEMKVQAAEAEARAKLEAAKQQVEVAKQEAEAKKIAAQNEAEIIEIQAQAQADAKAIIAATWESMSDEARDATLKQLSIEKWDGKLPETMVGDDFLNELLGALGK